MNTCKKCGMKADGSFRFPRAEVEYLNKKSQVLDGLPGLCLDCLIEVLQKIQSEVSNPDKKALHPEASILGVTVYFVKEEK